MSALAAVVLAGTVACGREPVKVAKVSDVLPNLPIPQDAKVISRAGSEDALQIVFTTEATPDQMSAFYRTTFTRPPWHLVSDQKTADGALTLYAESGGPPMWVTIRSTAGESGSTVELSGASAYKPRGADSTTRGPGSLHS
ncbi:MAG: hypothetical protein ABJD11_12820 [Gemmatimonadota bacterium]